jgi:hypothetical protein
MKKPNRKDFPTNRNGRSRYNAALRKYEAYTKNLTAKKPVAKKQSEKPVAKKPATTTRPKRTANQLKIKKTATTVQKGIKKATKTIAKKTGEAKKAVSKKLETVKKVKQKKSKAPQTTQQKAVSKVYKGTKGLVKRGLKGAKNLLKIRNLKGLGKQGVAGVGATGLAHVINKRVDRAFAASKGMTLKEFEKARQSEVGKRGFNRLRPKNIGNTINALKGKGKTKKEESSTSKNIKKQKKANTTPNRGLKIKKTERSSRKNTNKDYNASTATKKADKRFSTFRVNADENLKLQKERQKGNTETYSRKLSPQAKKTKTTTTTTTKSPKPGSARARLRAENVKRFGKAHVDRLVA